MSDILDRPACPDSVHRPPVATTTWTCDALSCLVDFASSDFGEGTPEEIFEPLVELLVSQPFDFHGAAVYQDDLEGWNRLASTEAMAHPALPVSDQKPHFTMAGRDLRIVLDGGGGGRILILRRTEEVPSEAERAVLDQMVTLLDNILDQLTYTNLLAQSEVHYRHIYSHANLGIFFSKVGGGLQRANPGCLAMLGYSTEQEMREAVVPLHDIRFFDPSEDRQRLIQKLVADGSVHDFQTRVRHADGSLVSVSLTCCLVQSFDCAGEDPSFFGFITDLTARDQTAEALREQRRAEIANNTKTHFLASVSHELRTPLNGVLGMVDILNTTELKDDQAEAVSVIQESAATLLELVNHILDYASLESGTLVLKDEPFAPAVMAQDVCRRWSEKASTLEMDLVSQIDLDLQAEVRGDEQRCGQIMELLLESAIGHTSRGGQVTLQIAHEGEAVKMVVTDTGNGFDNDQLEQILAGEAVKGGEGDLAGLNFGLSKVSKLVDLMDGRFWVDSSTDHGSRLSVLLPLPQIESQDQAKGDPDTNDGRMRVLIVEDNPVNQLVARKLLQSLDLDVTVADGGMSALGEVSRQPFDLVFMDLQMPGMDGFEATRALRSEVSFSGPVVAMTAHATEYHRDKCRQHGMNGFVTKPLERKRLADFLSCLPDRGDEASSWLWIEPSDNCPLTS